MNGGRFPVQRRLRHRWRIGLGALVAAGVWWGGITTVSAQTRIPATDDDYLAVVNFTTIGDRDRYVVVFFEFPATLTGPLYFAIQDPETGSDSAASKPIDESSLPGRPVVTSFSLYGGPGAFSDPATRRDNFGASTAGGDPHTGTRLARYRYRDRLTAVDGDGPNLTTFEDDWVFFPPVDVKQGELVGTRRYFKIVVEVDAFTTPDTATKNGFRLDVSTAGSGTPTGVASGRAFAYSWTVNFLNRTTPAKTWNFYPFVPEGATRLTLSSYDMDHGEKTTGPNAFAYDDTPAANNPLNRRAITGANMVGGDMAASSATVTVGAGQDAQTWRLTITEDGAGGSINTTEIYAATNAGAEPARIYAAPYRPAPPDHVVTTTSSCAVIGDGSRAARVVFQLVDAAGRPVTYERGIYVTITGSARIRTASSTTATLPATAALVTTDVEGIAWVEVVNSTAETVTVRAQTDGGSGSSTLPDPGANTTASITFVSDTARTPPVIELALGVAGTDRLYLKFSQPVFGTLGCDGDIAKESFELTPTNTPVELEVLTRSPTGAVEDVFLTLDRPITVDEVLSARIAAASNAAIRNGTGESLPASRSRRLTDVAIGIVEPVWATDSFGTGDAGAGAFRTIRSFTGGTGLFPTDITLQARLLTTNPALTTSLLYTIDPRLGAGVTYWSPNRLPGLVAVDRETPATVLKPTDVNGAFRNFQISGTDPALERGEQLQFQFRVEGAHGFIYAATVDDPTDPRTVRPWSFDLDGGLIAQRANVTILNNVIYPTRGENTILVYELRRAGMVNVLVFALDGTLVRTIQRGRQAAGTYRATWDGRNQGGRVVARGIYFIRVVAPGGIDEYRKVIVAKD